MSHDSSPDLSRIYRAGAREEPPAWLDARICTAAAAACEETRARAWGGLFRRWYIPAAAAAMVILSTSIVWLSRDDSGDSANSLTKQLARGPAEQRLETEVSAEKRALLPSLSPEPQAGRERSVQAGSPSPLEVPDTDSAKPALARDSLVDERTGLRASAAKEAAASPPAESPLVKAESLPAPAAAPPTRSLDEPAVVAGNASRSTELAPRRRAQDGVAVRQHSESESGLSREDPAKWLERIARLYDEGRDREARESLDRFRRAHPDYPIPDKLK